MNEFGAIVLAALLFEFLLSVTADLLNLRALRDEAPERFRDVYDRERYARSQEYTRVKTRFGFLPAMFDLALVLVFWFAGGFEWLDQWLRGFGFGPVVTGLCYIGALMLAKSILSLPFSWYSTFVIEERFGFNRTTKGTFVGDFFKGTLLTVILGGPLLAAVLAFFGWAGDAAWLYCWGFAAAFVLLIQFVAPAWIMPLFHKFEPLGAGELRDGILDYSKKVGFPLTEIFVVDGSRRSSKANAFFTGFGRNRRVALYDTLIEKHSVPEVVAVVAHEIGHYKRRHIVQGMAISLAHLGVVFFLLSWVMGQDGIFEAFAVTQPSVYTGLVFFGLLFAPLELVLSVCMQALSRRNEFQADEFAAKTTGRAPDLASALKKLAADTLSNLTPHPLYVKVHYSHPPMDQRIAALERLA